MQDILGGAAFCYMLCVCAWALKQEDCLSSREWRLLGLSCLAIIGFNTAWFYMPEPLKTAAVAIANITSIVWIIVFLIKTTKAFKEDAPVAKLIALTFALFAWCISTMYMADGHYYYVGLIFSIVAKLYMDMAVKREVTET